MLLRNHKQNNPLAEDEFINIHKHCFYLLCQGSKTTFQKQIFLGLNTDRDWRATPIPEPESLLLLNGTEKLGNSQAHMFLIR